jgi:hypothetical protein
MLARVSTNRRIAVAVAAVAVFWAGLAFNLSRPADDRAYQRTMLQVAESAHDAAQTARLVAQEQLAGRVNSAFASAAFGDAAKGLAGAQQKFAGEGPPDTAAAALRDRLSPLLQAAVIALSDASEATGDSQLKGASDRLDVLAKQLRGFITAQQ